MENIKDHTLYLDVQRMAAQIISAQASSRDMTTREILKSLTDVTDALWTNHRVSDSVVKESAGLQSVGLDTIDCLECGKIFKMLGARHLQLHNLTANEYRKKYKIPLTTPLSSIRLSERRSQMAKDRDLGRGLAEYRAKKRAAMKRQQRQQRQLAATVEG